MGTGGHSRGIGGGPVLRGRALRRLPGGEHTLYRVRGVPRDQPFVCQAQCGRWPARVLPHDRGAVGLLRGSIVPPGNGRRRSAARRPQPRGAELAHGERSASARLRLLQSRDARSRSCRAECRGARPGRSPTVRLLPPDVACRSGCAADASRHEDAGRAAMKKPELLAPGGSFLAAFYAFEAGADGVYLGLREFSARAAAKNFTLQQLRRIRQLAADRGRKIYITLNTVVRDEEMP